MTPPAFAARLALASSLACLAAGDYVLQAYSAPAAGCAPASSATYLSLLGCIDNGAGATIALQCSNESYGVLNFFSSPNCSGTPYYTQQPSDFLGGGGAFQPCAPAPPPATYAAALLCRQGKPQPPPPSTAAGAGLTLGVWGGGGGGVDCASQPPDGYAVSAVGACLPGLGPASAIAGPEAGASFQLACAPNGYVLTNFSTPDCSGAPAASAAHSGCEALAEGGHDFFALLAEACAAPAAPQAPAQQRLSAAASAAIALAVLALALGGGLAAWSRATGTPLLALVLGGCRKGHPQAPPPPQAEYAQLSSL